MSISTNDLRNGMSLDLPCAPLDQGVHRRRRIAHPESDRADRRPVHPGKSLGEAAGLGIDDEVDVALAVQQHIFRAVLRDRAETHLLE